MPGYEVNEISLFSYRLTESIIKNIGNWYGSENWDKDRYGNRNRSIRQMSINASYKLLNVVLPQVGIQGLVSRNAAERLMNMLGKYGPGLAKTYDLLSDDYSKSALIQVLTYRILGYRHVKLWTNTADYWMARSEAKKLCSYEDALDGEISTMPLYKTDLLSIGYPVTIYTNPLSITHEFLQTHYSYLHISPSISVSLGDKVIDGGAAWADTALRFAHEVGKEGEVYCFEFEPNNLEIIAKNLSLNPALATRISVIKNALWSNSHGKLGYEPKGPGTKIMTDSSYAPEHTVSSVSIDEFMKNKSQVDFIKMDLEGTELSALKGAKQTLINFRPKLAISLYHSVADFVEIPAFLSSLDLDYRFYLDHKTIHSEETILFASQE